MAQQAGERAVTLRWRVLRYPERKFCLAGQPFDSGDIEGLAPDEAVRRLARRLLGRIERPANAAAWLPVLEDTSVAPAQRARNVVQLIENSDEFRLLNKYAIYDLKRDPLELAPADPRRQRGAWDTYQQQVEIMQEIDRLCPPGRPPADQRSRRGSYPAPLTRPGIRGVACRSRPSL